ncbi:hypothetical protein SLOPH_1690 [Spraguea lophii 42_110]|uniref:Transcription regulator Rua1 C-terminal domain-containing protein n=1 Tax=Spraguea lophii (strain 42_110) TaxID=1358809 RepID=S7W9Y0_SPRLO|nr:hypothetical protein SLOPH_1690 [Spraguea lophii 42_110]
MSNVLYLDDIDNELMEITEKIQEKNIRCSSLEEILMSKPILNKPTTELYRPQHIRGKGNNREGFCKECKEWFRLKTSSYWYHMNFKHGINSKGVRYPEPFIRERSNRIESYCSICNKWVYLTNRHSKAIKYSWYKHWQKYHNELKIN